MVNGAGVFAATGGRSFDQALPTVIFVHGSGMDRTIWALQGRYLAHHGRNVFAIDLPGHGRSGGEPVTTVEALAQWLLDFLDVAGLETAALVGHSLGSATVLECAATAPERVRTLTLLGTAEKMPVHPALLEAAAGGHDLAHDLVTAWGHGRSAHLGGSTTPGLWMIEGGRRLLQSGPDGVLAVDLAASDVYAGADEAAGRVTCPTLLVLGADDRMTPRSAGIRFAEMIAGARVEVIARSGHMMMIERPDDTLRALLTNV